MKFFMVLFAGLLMVSCSSKNKGGTTLGLGRAPCFDSVCYLKIDAYPQEVAMVVPANADYKTVTIYLKDASKGMERDQSLKNLMESLELVSAFKESRSNRVLIVPFASGGNKEFQNLKTQAQLHNLIFNTYKTFGLKYPVTDIQIIAHGEGNVTVQNILTDYLRSEKLFSITQITILNGSTSRFSPGIYNRWLKSGQDNRMTVIYRKGSNTEDKAQNLWRLFSGSKVGSEGGINLANGDYLTLIPEVEFAGQKDAHWLIAKKWFGRSL